MNPTHSNLPAELGTISTPGAAPAERTKEALARFFREECAALLGRAWKTLHHLPEAEQAVEATALEAIRSTGSGLDPDSLPGWVSETLDRECRSRLARLEREAPTTRRPPGVEPDPEEDLLGALGEAGESRWIDDLDAFVRREVESLPAELRIVVERGGLGGEWLSHLVRSLGVPTAVLADRRRQAFEILRPRFRGGMRRLQP